jgi:carbon monoxide dehydrogenase subunit G
MASIHRQAVLDCPLATAWDALRDFGALHTRLAPGFVTDCRVLEEGVRTVTFANGSTVRERLVALDEAHHRLSYTILGGRAAHHNASAQLVAEGESRTRFIWITDVLPDTLADTIGSMMDAGIAAMRRALNPQT